MHEPTARERGFDLKTWSGVATGARVTPVVRRLIAPAPSRHARARAALACAGLLGLLGAALSLTQPAAPPQSASPAKSASLVDSIASQAQGALPSLSGVAHAAPPPADEGSAAAGSLRADLDALVDGARDLSGAQIGVSVVDLASGEVLYAREADRALNPASNAKLVTTAAALSILGPEHRYSTRVWTAGTIDADGVLQGDLYLQGGGDPSLVTGEVYELAGQLVAAGLTRVKGKIIVDATRFDGDGWPPGFEQKSEFASHRAPGGAMSVNYNTFEVHARPGAVGASPKLRLLPEVDDLALESKATTVAGKRNKLWVSTREEGGKTVVTFHGEIGTEAPAASYRYPVADPSRYAGELLALSLRQRGVKLGNKTRIQSGQVPSDARLLATHRSETLSQLCRSVNKWSNNFMAEQILRTLEPGDGATAEQALERMREYTKSIGVEQSGLVLGNGSGLYDNNAISPAAMTQLLAAVYADFRIRSDYLASLAVMGKDGTTRSRLHDSQAGGWVRVKTGTLDDVSALSGYAGAQGKDPIAFSILMNGLERKQRRQARALQDALAERIAAERAK